MKRESYVYSFASTFHPASPWCFSAQRKGNFPLTWIKGSRSNTDRSRRVINKNERKKASPALGNQRNQSWFGGGGGGFFVASEDFGRMFDNLFPASAFSFFFFSFFFLFFFFFNKWRLDRAHLFHFLGQDQSTVAQRAETTVTECSLTSYVWARFRIGSHTTPNDIKK